MKIENQILAPYTSWKIGGPAKTFFQPTDTNDLIKFLLTVPAHEQIFWMGNGSNLLIADAGINATVICVNNTLNNISKLDDTTIRVEAGATLAKAIRFCLDNNLAGPEFLAGVPGTIGGALFMNAGAFGGSFWQLVSSVETIDRAGTIRIRFPQDFVVSYRHVAGLGTDEWFLACNLKLTPAAAADTKAKMQPYLQRRVAAHPINDYTCGSVFKNPPNDSAGRLIEACGLKGYKIGGAEVSTKHANFIANKNNATAKDVIMLIALIQERVQKQFGIKLETEVKIITND
jgi:UDP-N-acetylmuramate dehydrogenase